jgi:hypothetical protein
LTLGGQVGRLATHDLGYHIVQGVYVPGPWLCMIFDRQEMVFAKTCWVDYMHLAGYRLDVLRKLLVIEISLFLLV